MNKELQRVNRDALEQLSEKGVMLKFPPALSSTHTALVLKEPKTKTSVRKIFLPKTVAEMLVKRYEERNCLAMNTRTIIWYSLRQKFNGGDMKSVQGDSGHAQVKMVADVYSHIIDNDRRLNAQRFEEQFYQTKETLQVEEAQQNTEPSVSPTDQEMLLKLLANPEMASLLKSLAKNL